MCISKFDVNFECYILGIEGSFDSRGIDVIGGEIGCRVREEEIRFY